eukprot:6037605-Prymnesium_polylepis.3
MPLAGMRMGRLPCGIPRGIPMPLAGHAPAKPLRDAHQRCVSSTMAVGRRTPMRGHWDVESLPGP